MSHTDLLASLAAIHTVLVLDTSSSIESAGLVDDLITAINETLAALKTPECRVSIVLFNSEVLHRHWRAPADSIDPFNRFTYPIDTGTSLYDALASTIARLNDEFLHSHGELNPKDSVHILVFTDGLDSTSRTVTRMEARLSIGTARARGWRITFMDSIPGLARSLGIRKHETVPLRLAPGGNLCASFRQATRQITVPRPAAASGPSVPTPLPTGRRTPPPASARIDEQPPLPVPPKPQPRRVWWRFW